MHQLQVCLHDLCGTIKGGRRKSPIKGCIIIVAHDPPPCHPRNKSGTKTAPNCLTFPSSFRTINAVTKRGGRPIEIVKLGRNNFIPETVSRPERIIKNQFIRKMGLIVSAGMKSNNFREHGITDSSGKN